MGRETCDVVLSNSVSDQNVIPGTWYFKCNRKPDWTIRKFKTQYYVRGDVQKRLSPKNPKTYYPVVQ